jgi:hypothetical protein
MPESERDDEEAGLIRKTILENDAYESQCRVRMWQIGVPLFATLACILCLLLCENCLLGVMLFCVLLCFRDPVLVLVFFVSLGLLLVRHPVASHTVHRVVDAGFVLMKPE